VITDDGVVFACDRHHVEMSEAKMIQLERMRGKETWNKISEIDEMEKEPPKENEIWCAYCGPGWQAVWEVTMNEGEVSVCNEHHFILRQIHVVGLERKLGEEEWKEAIYFKDQDLEADYLDDLGDWKDLIDHDDL